MAVAPRITSTSAPVQLGKAAPAPTVAPRITTTAPQKTMPRSYGPKYYAKGGKTSASKRADGIAQRGKTKGTMIMCGGGYTKGK